MASSWAEHASVVVTIREQGGKVRSYDLDDFVGFSMSQEKLRTQLHEHPAKFAYVAALFAAALVRRERLEERLSFTKAELFLKIKGQAEDMKLTVAETDAMVKTQKSYLAAQDEYLAAREQEESLRAMRDALIQRKDIMVLVANTFRREWDTDPGARVDRQAQRR